MRRRALLALVVATAAAGGVAWWWRRATEFRLPARIAVEQVLADLAASVDATAVVGEPADAPVRLGEVEPGDSLTGAGARPALLTPPPSRLRFRVDAPPGGVLRFSVAVEGARARRDGVSGVRFAVALDGREVWSRTVNPAATRHDRRWFDEQLPLVPVGGVVEVVLDTAAERRGLPLAGQPGWSRVQVVRKTTRERQPARADAANVLVLLVDALRADRLGCYGARPTPSPNLDALARQGLVFDDMVAQASWTLPSVASILTGLHPRRHGAAGASRPGAPGRPLSGFLVDQVVTLPELAADAGITTVGCSANPLVSRTTNLAQGFETFVEFSWDRAGRDWTPAADVNDVFLRWLGKNRGRRFLAYLHYMEPHDPYTPAAAYRPAPPPGIAPGIAAGWIRDVADRVNWGHAPPPSAPETDYLRALYDGEITTWDAELPTLLAGLDRLGVRGSTLVVVTADHGEEFLEHGHLTHGSHLYQESVHVPLVLSGPGIAAGHRADLAQGIDLFPTLGRALGLAVPQGLPGRDLLAGEAAVEAILETARGIGPDGRPIDVVALRTPVWKLIHTPALARAELYHLPTDGRELENRLGVASEGDELAAHLAAWQVATPSAPRPSGADPAFAEKLRALGYVQ